jgi:protein TonB
MVLAQASGNPAHRSADRLLAYAIAISLLAHALILALAPGWLDPKKKRASAPPPLVAHLVQPKPAPAPAPAPVVERPPQPEMPREAPRKPVPAARVPPKLVAPPTALPTPAPAIAPQPAPVPEPPRPAEAQPPVPPVATAPPVRVEPVPAPPAAPPPAETADPATLGQYRIAIITAAKRYKRYPRIAIDNNWEGQAEVRMVIAPDGSIASITIKTRSGYESLDQQALEMIRKAKPLTPIPASLRGRGFTVDVPVVFSLKEETG